MNFVKTEIDELMIIELDVKMDDRGDFTRLFCRRSFEENNLDGEVVQVNLSRNKIKGTIRGLHSQNYPNEEIKVVRCLTGAIFDVAVDLRKDSPTYLKWFGVELTENNFKMLYIPKGFAHGYQTLTDNASVEYLVTTYYKPDSEYGIRYNDPQIGITWPLPVSTISSKDSQWDLLKGVDYE